MALKTGNNKKFEKEETVDLSSLANLMKIVGDVTKEANELESAIKKRNLNKEK